MSYTPMEPASSEQTDTHYEQAWQEQLTDHQRSEHALRQQQEQARSQLQKSQAAERDCLTAQQEAERDALLRYHREQRIALGESQP